MDIATTREAVALFKRAVPDFNSFDDPGETLKRDELDYKHELAQSFQDLGNKLLNGASSDFIEQFHALLKTKLESISRPQNLVGWREQTALLNVLKADEAARDRFRELVRELLASADDDSSVWKALDEAVGWLLDQGLSAAHSKIWPTLILFLWRPEKYIFIKPRFFDSILTKMGLEKLGMGVKLTGEEYQRVMKDMERLKSQLVGLHINDYIELQSLLWMIDSADKKPSFVVNVWVVEVPRKQFEDADPLILRLETTKGQANAEFFSDYAKRLQAGDVLLVREQGTQNRILGEGRLNSLELSQHTLTLELTGITVREISVTATSKQGPLVPGLVSGIEDNWEFNAAELCREYLDSTRACYLLNWNPKYGGEQSVNAREGRFRYGLGEITDWACRSKNVSPGDPAYVLRLGSEFPRGIVAKVRFRSVSQSGEHWQPSKSGQVQDYALVEIEGISDGPADHYLPILELEAKFPHQHWTPESSGIVIKSQRRSELHEQWSQRLQGNSLLDIFEQWRNLSHLDYHNWIPRYRKTVGLVKQVQDSESEPDDDLFAMTWEHPHNGITGAYRGRLPRDVIGQHKGILHQIATKIMRTPTAETFEEVMTQFDELKADQDSGLNQVPGFLVRRAFAASNPRELFTICSNRLLDMCAAYIRDKYGETILEHGQDSWFVKNQKLRQYFLKKGIPDHDLATFNTFAHYLYTRLEKMINGDHPLPPINVIFYGPPGTGKTYTLRNKYFPQYTSNVSAVSTQDWIDQVLNGMKWREVIAAALHSVKNRPSSSNEILNHEYVQAKARLQGHRELYTSFVMWYLRKHSSPNCPNVHNSSRKEPSWFWKNEDSTWMLTPGWEESGDLVLDYVSKLESPPEEENVPIKRFEFVTFHQSYSYEEFVEGIRPTLGEDGDETGEVSYLLHKGVFRRLCERARADSEGKRYALFIDEINRGNISKIFGELITLIEEDKRERADNELSVVLPYSGDIFSVPGNLDIFGTMNTADRSLAHIDTALRRRFTFTELIPNPELLSIVLLDGQEIDLKRMLEAMNDRIEALFDREHTIGHAYFLKGKGQSIDGSELHDIFQNKIIPLLTEYFFDDWSKVRTVLADDRTGEKTDTQFVLEIDVEEQPASTNRNIRNKSVYRLNRKALKNPASYQKIYTNTAPH